MLSLMTFFPLLGMLLILTLPRNNPNLVRWFSLLSTAVPLAIGGWLLFSFDRGTASMQFVERLACIRPFNIEYYMGVDVLSFPMILLTVLLSFLCVIASWNISMGVQGYHAMFLFLETGMLGVFCALDFFLFFLF